MSCCSRRRVLGRGRLRAGRARLAAAQRADRGAVYSRHRRRHPRALARAEARGAVEGRRHYRQSPGRDGQHRGGIRRQGRPGRPHRAADGDGIRHDPVAQSQVAVRPGQAIRAGRATGGRRAVGGRASAASGEEHARIHTAREAPAGATALFLARQRRSATPHHGVDQAGDAHRRRARPVQGRGRRDYRPPGRARPGNGVRAADDRALRAGRQAADACGRERGALGGFSGGPDDEGAGACEPGGGNLVRNVCAGRHAAGGGREAQRRYQRAAAAARHPRAAGQAGHARRRRHAGGLRGHGQARARSSQLGATSRENMQ